MSAETKLIVILLVTIFMNHVRFYLFSTSVNLSLQICKKNFHVNKFLSFTIKYSKNTTDFSY